MSDPSDNDPAVALRDKVIGLGENSLRKSHYAALQRSLRELEEKDRLIRRAYSDVIAAITGGRLVLLGNDELEQALVVSDEPTYRLDGPEQLSQARALLGERLGHAPACENLVLAFSEAATNMLKHAGGGDYQFAREDDCVQLILSDTGPGIDFRHLPKATLTAGYSTAQTLGMGFTVMLELTDRLLLCTDDDGTTLVLEKDISTAEKSDRLGLSGLES